MAEQITAALAELDTRLLLALAVAPKTFQLRAHALLRLGRWETTLKPLPLDGIARGHSMTDRWGPANRLALQSTHWPLLLCVLANALAS